MAMGRAKHHGNSLALVPPADLDQVGDEPCAQLFPGSVLPAEAVHAGVVGTPRPVR